MMMSYFVHFFKFLWLWDGPAGRWGWIHPPRGLKGLLRPFVWGFSASHSELYSDKDRWWLMTERRFLPAIFSLLLRHTCSCWRFMIITCKDFPPLDQNTNALIMNFSFCLLLKHVFIFLKISVNFKCVILDFQYSNFIVEFKKSKKNKKRKKEERERRTFVFSRTKSCWCNQREKTKPHDRSQCWWCHSADLWCHGVYVCKCTCVCFHLCARVCNSLCVFFFFFFGMLNLIFSDQTFRSQLKDPSRGRHVFISTCDEIKAACRFV